MILTSVFSVCDYLVKFSNLLQNKGIFLRINSIISESRMSFSITRHFGKGRIASIQAFLLFVACSKR